jgi:hypothetical protein
VMRVGRMMPCVLAVWELPVLIAGNGSGAVWISILIMNSLSVGVVPNRHFVDKGLRHAIVTRVIRLGGIRVLFTGG